MCALEHLHFSLKSLATYDGMSLMSTLRSHSPQDVMLVMHQFKDMNSIESGIMPWTKFMMNSKWTPTRGDYWDAVLSLLSTALSATSFFVLLTVPFPRSTFSM